MMYCNKCGAQMPDGAKFCTKCGGAMKVAPSPKPPKKSGGKAPLVIALVVVGLVAVGAIVLLVLSRLEAPQGEPLPKPTPTAVVRPSPTPIDEVQQLPQPTPMPAVTTPAATEAVALTADEQGRMNLFLSNFSEQSFGDYERGVSPESQIINFSFWQVRRNGNAVTYDSGKGEVLAADELEAAAQRFFGVIPARQSTDVFTYADGVYAWTGADGAPFYLTVADSVVRLPDGTHQVAFTIYWVDDYEMDETVIMDDLYALTPDQAAAQVFLYPEQSGTAILEDATHNEKPFYHLVKYTLD